VKDEAQIREEGRAIRAWGVRAGITLALVFLLALGWTWFRDQSGLEQLFSILIRATLVFCVVYALAWMLARYHTWVEHLPDPRDDEA